MTTPEAARRYLQAHQAEWNGMPVAVFNPKGLPVEELPVIYGFNNGGRGDNWYGALLAEDGAGMGGHLCSNEFYMPHDLGVLEGARPDRHEGFQKHYPDGYRMEFVPYDGFDTHEGLKAACEANQKRATPEAETETA